MRYLPAEMKEKFKKDFFSCLDKIVELSKEKELVIVDGYQDHRFLGASMPFLEEIVPNSTIMMVQSNDEYNKVKDKDIQFVIFCELTNRNNNLSIEMTEGDINDLLLFWLIKDTPCIIVFVDVPYQYEKDLANFQIPDMICEYSKLKENQ